MCECKNLVIQSSKEKKYHMNVQSVLIELFTKIEFYEVYSYFGMY